MLLLLKINVLASILLAAIFLIDLLVHAQQNTNTLPDNCCELDQSDPTGARCVVLIENNGRKVCCDRLGGQRCLA